MSRRRGSTRLGVVVTSLAVGVVSLVSAPSAAPAQARQPAASPAVDVEHLAEARERMAGLGQLDKLEGPGKASTKKCAVFAAADRKVPRKCRTTGAEIVFDAGHSELAAEVPEPGQRVVATHMYQDGSTSSLTVDTDPEGVTEYAAEHDEHAEHAEHAPGDADEVGGSGTNSGPNACVDGAYTLSRIERGGVSRQMRWFSTMNWYFRRSSVPGDLPMGDVIAAVRRGPATITTGRNDCGIKPRISATAAYKGGTRRFVNISGDDKKCAANPDGVSVVSFGNIESDGPLAASCTWARYNGTPRHRITESDVRLDASNRRWWLPGTERCENFLHYSLPSVSVHEFGHAFGLGHVSESAHGKLTMSTRMQRCDDSATTLGLGDVRALERLY